MFTIYATETCSYCVKATNLLSTLGFSFNKEVLDTEEKKQAFKARGFRTVPQIYYNGTLIGGYDHLVATIKEKFETSFDD